MSRPLGNILTDATLSRLMQSAEKVEALGEMPKGKTDYPTVHILKIVSGAATADGYPARIMDADAADLLDEDVRVLDWNGGTLAEDDYVSARFMKFNDDNEACYSVCGGTNAAYDVEGRVSASITGQYMGLGPKFFSGLVVNANPTDTYTEQQAAMNDVTAGQESGKLIVQAQLTGLGTSLSFWEIDPEDGVCRVNMGVSDEMAGTPRSPLGFSNTSTIAFGNYEDIYEAVVTNNDFGGGGTNYVRHFARSHGPTLMGGAGVMWGWYDDTPFAGAGGLSTAVDYWGYMTAATITAAGGPVAPGFFTTKYLQSEYGLVVNQQYGAGALSGTVYYGGTFRGGVLTSGLTSVPVTGGGTGATSFTAGQLLAGNGASALDSLTSTRILGEALELKLAADRWIAFAAPGSF